MGRVAATDSELIQASQRGDQVAFGVIVERYQRAVYAVSYSGTGEHALSEDVAQDTFVTAWNQLGSLRDVNRLPAWLCGIARNLARTARRRQHREAPSEDIEIVAPNTPFDALSEHEADAAVAAALQAVPDTYREPLVLFYYEQRSVKDVAAALGITEAATHQRLSRGRQCLAQGVGDLVERALERKRPRRDLAAAVLGILAVVGSSSRVEASTGTKGASSMLKIGIGAVLVTAAVGTGYVVKRSSADPLTTSAASAEREPTKRSTSPLVRSGFFIGTTPRTGTVARSGGAGAAPVVLDCTTTVNRLAELMLETRTDATPADPATYGRMLASVAEKYERECVAEAWSQELMACIVGATDSFNASVGCSRFKTEPAVPPEPLPGEFSFPLVAAVPGAKATGIDCTAIGSHVASLMQPDPAAIAQLPEDAREGITMAIGQARLEMPSVIEAACEQGAWSEEARTCMAAATTSAAFNLCM